MLYELLMPLGLALVGWAQSLLLSLQTWESVRYARRRLAQKAVDTNNSECPDPHADPVAVLVPCKGADDDLRSNLQALFDQTYPHYEIVFLVESPEDAANRVLLEMIDDNCDEVAARIVYTGRAIESGQKVHNLLRAVETLSDQTAILAFVDSDAGPKREWLSRLVEELDRPVTGAATGYRWMIPASNNVANLLVYSLNSALAGLLGPGGHYHVWGGSWAIRRKTFEDVGLREAWHGTLSDDLVASRVLHAAGLKVRFAPHCVSRSHVDNDWSSAYEFICRQYLIARKYAPRLWRLGLLNCLTAQLGIWGSLAFAIFAENGTARIVAIATFGLLYAMAMLRGHWRQKLALWYAPEHAEQLRVAQISDTCLSPVFGLVNLFLITASAFGSQIQWRGIRYWIAPGGRILTMGRQPDIDADQEPIILQFPSQQTAAPVTQHDISSKAA